MSESYVGASIVACWLTAPILAWLACVRPARWHGIGGASALALAAGGGFVLWRADIWSRGALEIALVYPAVALAGVLVVMRNGQPVGQALGRPGMLPRLGKTLAIGQSIGSVAVAGLSLVLLAEPSSPPPADSVPKLPSGFTQEKATNGCGSGSCWRTEFYRVDPGTSQAAVDAVLHDWQCRPNGLLLDRRHRCVEVRRVGERVGVTMSLSDRFR